MVREPWESCSQCGGECEAVDVNDHIPFHNNGMGCPGCGIPGHCQAQERCEIYDVLSQIESDATS